MNNEIRYEPDGGDLGVGKRVTLIELELVVPHIANIFQALVDEARKETAPEHYRPLKYGFTLDYDDRRRVSPMVDYLNHKLPKDVFFYQADGRRLFEVRSQIGTLTTSLACYLVTVPEI